jgi:hypothetical protein
MRLPLYALSRPVHVLIHVEKPSRVWLANRLAVEEILKREHDHVTRPALDSGWNLALDMFTRG